MLIHRPLKSTKHNPLLLIIRGITKTHSTMLIITIKAQTFQVNTQNKFKLPQLKQNQNNLIAVQKVPKKIKLFL